jgi:DNA-binding beta-propeller fold protein YncE
MVAMRKTGTTRLALALHAAFFSLTPLFPQAAALGAALVSPEHAQGEAARPSGAAVGLYVQPYAGARLSIEGKPASFALLKNDNSLGLLSVGEEAIAAAEAGEALQPGYAREPELRIRMAGYEPYSIGLSDLRGAQEAGSPAFIVLKKRESSYAFQRVIATGKQPKSVTFIDDSRVAVALLEGPGIDIVDVYSGRSQRIAPPPPYAARLGFVESLVLAERDELWVSQMTTGSIHVFSLSTLSYKTTIRSSGVWGKVLAYNPVLDRVFFSNWVSQDISVIDPDSYREERRVDCGAVPRGMAFSEDGRFMYLAQYEVQGKAIGRLLKVDVSSMAIVARLGVEGSKRHIVTDAKRKLLYVSDMARDIIEVYDLRDDSLIASIAVGAKPNTIELSPDGRLLYVSCRGPNNPDKGYLYKGYEFGRVYVLDAETLSVREWWEGGNQPTGLDVAPDGRLVVFSDFLDARLRVYRREAAPRAPDRPSAEEALKAR